MLCQRPMSCSVQGPKERPEHPVWVAAVGDGAAAECAGRHEPTRMGTVTLQHRPKILIVHGAADRAASVSGRSLLLALLDSFLASPDDPDVQHVLRNVSIHFILDADPSAEDADCTSSSSTGSGAKAEEMMVRFAAREKFAMILAVDFKTVGLVGSSLSNMRQLLEKQMADGRSFTAILYSGTPLMDSSFSRLHSATKCGRHDVPGELQLRSRCGRLSRG